MLVSISRDITELTETQKMIAKSEEMLRLISEHSPLGIAIIKKYKIVYANDRLAMMFGRTLSEVMKKSFGDLVDKKDKGKVDARIKQLERDVHQDTFEIDGISGINGCPCFECFGSRLCMRVSLPCYCFLQTGRVFARSKRSLPRPIACINVL
jgi:transcriptional regulator with PAS, ATPase and Fis domain